MARHPWVAEADNGIRWGIQLVLGDAGMETLRERARLVEQLGFDGFFLFDHPALQPDPWLCLAALSSVTEKVRLGSVVNCVGYRHPAALARYAADLDNLSNGRLMLGPRHRLAGAGVRRLRPAVPAAGRALRPARGDAGDSPGSLG
jgi:hypothetical protein